MKIIHDNGIVDMEWILRNIGDIDFYTQDYSKVSRTLYPAITDLNCFKLSIRTTKPTFLDSGSYTVIYETSAKEKAEELRKEILNAFTLGKKQFIINEKSKEC